MKAPRGRIFDRFGVPLVNNVPSVDVVVVPADLPSGKEDIDLAYENHYGKGDI